MSIGRRLIDLARAELNALLERAAESDDEDGEGEGEGGRRGGARGRTSVESMTDDELLAEVERRRRVRESAAERRAAREEADRMREATAEAERAARGPRADARSGAGPRRRPNTGTSDDLARAYAALEVKPGSDFETVRRAYRNLMRKYHPDHHTASPEKQRAANELAQKLTDAYKLLERRLR